MLQLKGVAPGNTDALMRSVSCPRLISEEEYSDLVSQKEFQIQYAVELQTELVEAQRQLKSLQETEPRVIEKVVPVEIEGEFEGRKASDWAAEAKDFQEQLNQLLQAEEKDASVEVPPSSDNQEVKEPQMQIKFEEPYASESEQPPATDQAEVAEALLETEPFPEGKLLYTGKGEKPAKELVNSLWDDLLQEIHNVHKNGVLRVVDQLEKLQLEPTRREDADAISDFIQCSKGRFESQNNYWDRKEHLARKAFEILIKE